MLCPSPRRTRQRRSCRAARAARACRAAVLCLSAGALLAAVAAPSATAKPFSFEPIQFQRIPLPKGVSATIQAPAFTPDGKHLLFAGKHKGDKKAALWITDLKGGNHVRCITCSGPAVPDVNYVFPFRDGKRIFIGFHGVVECAPSVVKCRTYKYLPYDLTTANPPGGSIPPGGAATKPQLVVSQGAYPTLAQDGKHIGYSDIRSDGFEEMIVAKLVRQSDKYVAEDPKVINPPGPTSATDPRVGAWSNSSGLNELKTFTHGGRDVTYVQVGGQNAENPEVWEVNLKTGVRKRLTSHPDWDEDFAGSPNGQSLAVWSNRNIHLIDGLGGLMPYRSFIEAPEIAREADTLINTPNNIACGGVMYLMPSDGDHGGRIGEPIVAPDVHAHTTVVGWTAWSTNGTKFALNALKYGAGLFSHKTPHFLLVAKFAARKASKPESVVSSDVGSWAPSPVDWHPPYGFVGTVTLNGPGGGTVKVTYNGALGALSGNFSETYTNYSEDGKTFLNGTETIDILQSPLKKIHQVTKLTMTGQHTGSINKDLTQTAGDASTGTLPTYQGHSRVTYDGTTVTGPPKWLNTKGKCPNRRPTLPRLHASAKRLSNHRYAIKVTAVQGGMGQNERQLVSVPVYKALIRGGGRRVYTSRNGIAYISAAQAAKYRVTAGETLVATTVRLK